MIPETTWEFYESSYVALWFSVLLRAVALSAMPFLWLQCTVVDVDLGNYGNVRGSRNRGPAGINSPHVYAVSYTRRPAVASSSSQLDDATTSRCLPRDERHVTFADLSPMMADDSDVGGRDAGNSSRYGSSEFSDVTSVTSGSYYIGEDSRHQPVSFIFV